MKIRVFYVSLMFINSYIIAGLMISTYLMLVVPYILVINIYFIPTECTILC
jgi:hypothetical protein